MKKYLIIVIVLMAAMALADSEGPNSPASSFITPDPNDWSNITNAYSSDDAYASITAATQDTVEYCEFNFAIDIAATIDSFKVKLEGQDGSGIVLDVGVCEDIRNELTTSWEEISLPTKSEGVDSAFFSGSGFSPSEVNSVYFGIYIRKHSTSPDLIDVDHATITAFFTLPSSASGQVIIIGGD